MGRLLGIGEELSVERNSAEPHEHWFEPLADHMGAAYLQYSFTKGTVQEVDALEKLLDLVPGMAILDVGCGPGRHSLEFARRGYRVTGIDISAKFIDLARESAARESLDVRFERHDARSLPGPWSDQFDAVICLCQGGFGLMVGEGEDERVFSGIASCVKPSGQVALSAFNSYFAVKHFAEAEFDADRGICVESTEVRDGEGQTLPTTLWTGCYTPRELRLLAKQNGLTRLRIHGVEPGHYGSGKPSTELPEFLLLAERER